MSSLPRHSGQRTIQRGLPKSRCGESARRYIRRGGSVGGLWRRRLRGASRHDNLPSSPSMASRNEVWKAEGVSTFPRRVGPGTWYPHIRTTTSLMLKSLSIVLELYRSVSGQEKYTTPKWSRWSRTAARKYTDAPPEESLIL